jgi:periplasmic protein CpxP/Spy
MRTHTLLALTLAGVSILTMSAVAQNDNNDQQAAPAEHRGRHMDPAKRTEMLTKQLNLTSDQQAKVLEVFKGEQSQMESLHSDSSLSQDDRRSKMMEIRKTSNDQVRALLDPDQQKKFDTMQSEHRQWGHHEGGQGPGPSGDSR